MPAKRGLPSTLSSLAFPQGRGRSRGTAKALAGSVEQCLGERVLEFLGLHVGVVREGEAADDLRMRLKKVAGMLGGTSRPRESGSFLPLGG